MAAEEQALPKTHRALVLHSLSEDPKVVVLATPQATPGSAVVRILVASVVSYAADIYNGKRQHPFPMPLVIGSSAIGRVAVVGPDSTALQTGQLVFIDCVVRSRDDRNDTFLAAIHQGFTPGSSKLMHGEWRDFTYAEYAKVPLENCTMLDEARLTGSPVDGGLDLAIDSLAFISGLLVPYGGLRSVSLSAGETVIVAPATGSFGGAAVRVALAMGARVIAMGRQAEALERVAAMSTDGRVSTVPITGDGDAELAALRRLGPADVFFDISPPAAAASTHLRAGILALRHGGRVSMMGGIRGDIALPYSAIMHRNLLLRGRWMYERDDILSLLRLVETGLLKLGPAGGLKVAGKYPLEEWKRAFTMAQESAGSGTQTLLAP